MNKHTFDPDYAVPPGVTLLETINAFGLTQRELAQRMGRPLKTINEIIKGVAAITPETSLQLEKVTGIAASFWNNAEANYRERSARLKEQNQIKKQIHWLKHFSYKKIIDMELVPNTASKTQRVENLLDFFGIASSEQWEPIYSKLQGAAREGNKLKSELGDLSVWLRAGELCAQRSQCVHYDSDRFKKALDKIRQLTRKSLNKVWPDVCRLCAQAGVAVVIVPELPKTHVYGFTRWLKKDKALIQLSLRYKTDDMLWFTFFHEAAHILVHGKKDIFLESRGVENKKESEANQWAADFLIPAREWKKFVEGLLQPIKKAKVESFSCDQGIASSIVVGRLQKEKHLRYKSRLNELKQKVEIRWQGLP